MCVIPYFNILCVLTDLTNSDLNEFWVEAKFCICDLFNCQIYFFRGNDLGKALACVKYLTLQND